MAIKETKMNKILALLLTALTSITVSAPLTDTDIKNLKKRKNVFSG